MSGTTSILSTSTFRLGSSKYDQSTFRGRLLHFFDVVDPRTLFATRKDLDSAIALLDEFQFHGAKPEGVTDDELWSAQKIKQAIIHPDTGEKIPMPFRMSGFVPFGSPIVFGLLIPTQSLTRMVFWQWLNQSHNACVNYCNRNASQPTPTSRFVVGYASAISSACGIAVGLSVLLKRSSSFSPATRLIVQRFVPFPAVAAASVSNCILMRFSELKEGILVRTRDGLTLGKSRVAAKKALQETAISRALLPVPCFVLPPLVMMGLERVPAFARRPRLHLPALGVVTILAFGLGLPTAIAIFPQFAELDKERLEHDLKADLKRLRPDDDVVVFNKGL